MAMDVWSYSVLANDLSRHVGGKRNDLMRTRSYFVQYNFTTVAQLDTQVLTSRPNQLFWPSLDPQTKRDALANCPRNMDRGRLETALIRAELGGRALKSEDLAIVSVLLGMDKVQMIEKCGHFYPKVRKYW